MLIEPKGINYWTVDKLGNQTIAADAPAWAKKEFEEYQKLMAEEPDKNGILKQQ